MTVTVEDAWPIANATYGIRQEASEEVWGVKELRPTQLQALTHIVTHPSLLLIGRTAIGKSHFVRMIGTVLGGLVVVVVPLLAF